MHGELKRVYEAEMAAADAAWAEGALDRAFAHLERAHILSQRYLAPHLITHWRMLRIARARRDAGETRGQIVRLLAVLVGYASGWVPKGNTGGANVSAVRPMPPPPDLAPLIADYNVGREIALRAAVLICALMLISAWAP